MCSRENWQLLSPVEENVGTNERPTSLAITEVEAVELCDVKPLVRPFDNLDDETETGPEKGRYSCHYSFCPH